MDPQRVRSISTGLMRLGRSLGEVGAEGTSCIGELQQVWAGPDLESFVTTWHASARSIDDASVSMCRFADILVAQAGQQEDTSAGAGGGPGGGARGGRNGGPRGGNPDIADGQKNGSQYEKINGPIDDGDITADDVSQGALGDCWFISSMMGVANANPELLRDNIKDNGDGTYDVTLYDDGKPVVVRVSGDFPANQGDPTYADNNGGNRELWPLLFEKAAAQHFGGSYADLDGDWPSKAIEAITGQEVETYDDNPLIPFEGKDLPPSNELGQRLQDGGVIVASTNGDGEKSSEGEPVSNHAYVVTDIAEDGTVTVQNPWGSSQYPPITMSYEEFESRFARFDVGKTR